MSNAKQCGTVRHVSYSRGRVLVEDELKNKLDYEYLMRYQLLYHSHDRHGKWIASRVQFFQLSMLCGGHHAYSAKALELRISHGLSDSVESAKHKT